MSESRITLKIKELIFWLTGYGQVAERIDAYSVILSYAVLVDGFDLDDIIATAKEEMKGNRHLYESFEKLSDLEKDRINQYRKMHPIAWKWSDIKVLDQVNGETFRGLKPPSSIIPAAKKSKDLNGAFDEPLSKKKKRRQK